MCGILGVAGGRVSRGAIEAAVERMAHRGPDDRGVEGFDLGDEGELWLAFRRLSILDLSPRGCQPMSDEAGEVWVVFNGEIYNFRELRRELEAKGHRFRSGTDTEVLLYGYREWGLDLLPRLVGMFAFGLWDGRRRELVLARDRLGIKPLYYYHDYYHAGGRLAFASEVKALLALPFVGRELDAAALARYFTFLWVPAPDTMFRGVKQLEAGTLARFRAGQLRIERYWDVPVAGPDAGVARAGGAREARSEPAGAFSEAEAVERLDALLFEAVRDRLVSDVPLGAFLSGGVDSSLIVALMRRAGVPGVLTQTVVFPPGDERYHIEAPDVPYARRVRDHFGDLDYHEILLEPRVAELLPKLVWHLDDPVADPAAIATYLICRAAKERATVMLAGMGAEELFAGYPRHRAVLLAERYRKAPAVVRARMVRPLVERLPASRPGPLMTFARNAKKFVRSAELPFEDGYLGYLSYYEPGELTELLTGEVLEEGVSGSAGQRVSDVYGAHRGFLEQTVGRDAVFRMTHLDLKTFLPGLNLAYTDRASMAASVEVRVPMVDHRVVEFAMGLPSRLKIRGRTQKHVLKEVARRYLPREIVERPKSGFGAPVRAWVVRDLRPMISDLLSPERLRRRGILRPAAVWRVIEDCWAGREDNALRIWALLTFELWAETFLDRDGSANVPPYSAPRVN